MTTLIIRNEKDIEKLQEEDNYIIDVFPSVKDEDQFVTEKMYKTAQRLLKLIEDRFSTKKENVGLSLLEIKKKYTMKELKVLARTNGIKKHSRLRKTILIKELLKKGVTL